MTRKTFVVLPLLALGFFLAIAAVFYVRVSCVTDGRESSGDKHEWSILESLEDTHRDTSLPDVALSEHETYHIACVPSLISGKRVWIMLDPRNPPFYKQMPHDDYSLSREQYDKIVATRHTSSTVEEALSSHVR